MNDIIDINHFVKEMNTYKLFGLTWLNANVFDKDFFVLYIMGECFPKKKEIIYGDIKTLKISVLNFLIKIGKITDEQANTSVSISGFLIPFDDKKWILIRDKMTSIVFEQKSENIQEDIDIILKNIENQKKIFSRKG